jgi:hypothetical protein
MFNWLWNSKALKCVLVQYINNCINLNFTVNVYLFLIYILTYKNNLHANSIIRFHIVHRLS